MAEKAQVVYLDELGNVVPRQQARRVRITLVGLDGSPLREIWGVVHRPGEEGEWPRRDSDFELLT
jgi:hypothetical protein